MAASYGQGCVGEAVRWGSPWWTSFFAGKGRLDEFSHACDAAGEKRKASQSEGSSADILGKGLLLPSVARLPLLSVHGSALARFQYHWGATPITPQQPHAW